MEDIMGQIKEQMKKDMQIRGLSKRTQDMYLFCAERFVKYFMKSPVLLTEKDINNFQYHLVNDLKLNSKTINIYVCAIKFLYKITLWDKIINKFDIELIPMCKVKKRLPFVLSKEEIIRLYKTITFIKYRAIFLTMYSAGLRSSEVRTLKVGDIDSKRMVIKIRDSKNNKDRYVMLSEKLLKELRFYYKCYKHKIKDLLFPGRDGKRLHGGTIRHIIKIAAKRANIKKEINPHTLRHSFATHMLENNIDIRRIQLLLGHRCLRTTAKYTHVTGSFLNDTKSPLDSLNLNIND